MQHFERFKELIKQQKKCVIVTHTRPDADALGSSLALNSYLQKKGHSSRVITPTDYPKFLKWMSGNDGVLIFSKENHNQVQEEIGNADIIFCLDFSSLDRIDELGDLIRKQNKSVKVLIDHHLDPEDFADYVSWSTNAAATAELVFELIEDLGDLSLVDRGIAENLYAGLMTDTGSFRHPSTSANVFRIAGQLVEKGADINLVSRRVYDSNSLSRLRLIGFSLSERLKVLHEFRTAFFFLSADDLKKHNYSAGDTEGFGELRIVNCGHCDVSTHHRT